MSVEIPLRDTDEVSKVSVVFMNQEIVQYLTSQHKPQDVAISKCLGPANNDMQVV